MGMTLLSLISLFVSCFILMMGNGLLNVFMPVKMELENLSTDTIGMVLSLYYVGMLAGAIYSKHLIKRAGHIRVFAGVVALGAVSILMCSFATDPVLWGAMRITIGFCNACAYTAMESWLSASSTKETRGKVLASYNAVVLGGLFAGQFLLNVASPAETTLFIIGGVLLCLAIIPMVLSRQQGPIIDDVAPMSVFSLIKKSPLGVVCCVAGGMIFAALLNMLPVFAKYNNIVDFELTLYMGAAIFGAFVLQFPVGYLSDKFDRRTVIVCLLLISASICLLVTAAAAMQVQWLLFVATGITTGIIACIYPLSISQTFDNLRQNEMVSAMASMILAFSIGGVLGPYSASVVMDIFGNNSLFYYLAFIQGLLILFVIYRMSVSEALPIDKQENFVMQSASVPAIIDLDPRTEYIPTVAQWSSDAQTAINIAQTDQGAAVKMARAIAVSQPTIAVEMARALASVEGIDVLRLYAVMREALPYRIMEITRAIVATQPDLAYELVQKLAETHPEQVVSVAAEIGHAFPEIRVSMAKIAVESAPGSALQVAEYYAKVVADEREALRPADEEQDTSEQDVIDIASEIWEVSPDLALDVAVAMAEAVPETSVGLASGLAENIINTSQNDVSESGSSSISDEENSEFDQDYQQAIETAAAIELLQKFTEVAPQNALDVAAAVVEALPDSAADVAAQFISNLSDASPLEEGQKPDSDLERAHQAALNTDLAIDLVQRLSEAAPENATDVAAAVVEVMPYSASQLLDNISAGKESIEGEWISSLDDAPRYLSESSEDEQEQEQEPNPPS